MKTLIAIACCVSCQVCALEPEIQFENDQVCISKMVIMPHEQIGSHRDEYPHVVVAIKGGTITRLEADGSTTDIEFPKGEGVYREADPAGEVHSSVNNSCKPLELIVVQLKG